MCPRFEAKQKMIAWILGDKLPQLIRPPLLGAAFSRHLRDQPSPFLGGSIPFRNSKVAQLSESAPEREIIWGMKSCGLFS